MEPIMALLVFPVAPLLVKVTVDMVVVVTVSGGRKRTWTTPGPIPGIIKAVPYDGVVVVTAAPEVVVNDKPVLECGSEVVEVDIGMLLREDDVQDDNTG